MGSENQLNKNKKEIHLPASAITKQMLLDIIIAKSAGGSDFEDQILQTLFFDDDRKGTITVCRFYDGASLDNPRRMAQISRIQWPGELYGVQLITNYLILKAPNGLELEKHSLISDPRGEMLFGIQTMEDIEAAATRTLAKIEQQMDTEAIENELGLSSVSEEEAKMILALVEEAKEREESPF